ncbi:hypothetical protein ASPZODRAFT_152374 [Penicilliopsis zonata CBS 506.65]|uniref:Uncharacterized protein n=1 Tax=Penicilliopsis zonata CBS 506.65 TaxID=1073090 RepID=A0A1L9SG75_9EURO|nr:hypothetical protein ASPZODRAFT_152374 [Penicilliopsis zonata CBS 506.65]OJJ46166.1 hypothetical protein ASPZODRAFT_152374 [Penicilliopsis zonata CBS 506.65]
MADRTEILVHVSAPSGARDDARYRAEVEAILGFQVAARHSVIVVTEDELRSSSRSSKDSSQAGNEPAGDDFGTPLSVIPDSQPALSGTEGEHPPEEVVLPLESSAKRQRVVSPAKRACSPEEGEGGGGALKKAVPQPSSTKNNTGRAIQAVDTAGISLSQLPLQIHPPPPPASGDPFVTHITPTLAMLAARLNPQRSYKPVWQTRPLDPLERGHWLIDIEIPRGQQEEPPSPSMWDRPFISRFWTFLRDFIARDGRAGWGVWCILERSEPEATDNAEMKMLLKVYAWGETAVHIYLLLFLASERRIRGMGAQWRDGGNDTVIQM